MKGRSRRLALVGAALAATLALSATAHAERVVNRPTTPGQGQGAQNPGNGGQGQGGQTPAAPTPSQGGGQGAANPGTGGQGSGGSQTGGGANAGGQGPANPSPGQGGGQSQGGGQGAANPGNGGQTTGGGANAGGQGPANPGQGGGQSTGAADAPQGAGQNEGGSQGQRPAAGQGQAQRPTVANGRPTGPATAVTPTATDEGPARRSIVVLRDGVEDVVGVATGQAAREAAGGAPERIFSQAIKGWAGALTAAARRRLEADPRVLFVSSDRRVDATAAVRATDPVPTGVARIGGPSPLTSYPGVAVIDTGIAKHAELNVQGGWNCLSGPVRSWGDANGHGTHVAGTIGARANDAGVVGVAPGAPLYAVRVLDRSGSGSWSSVICGLEWAVRNAGTVKVVNLSLGGGGSDGGSCGQTTGDALHRAICNAVAAGITVVVAAGNAGANVSTSVPAAYDETIAVSALADYDGAAGGLAAATCGGYGADDTFAGFSNYATSDADRAHMLAAPGACIRSTWLKGGYQTLSGTSMASPHVAGAAAALLAATPGLSPAAVRDALRGSGEALGAGHLDPRGLNPEPLLRRP